MIEAVLVTLFPVGFLVILFGGGELFRRRNIGQDGEAPINRALFYASKYSILVLWVAMVMAAWGIGFTHIETPLVLRLIALLFWTGGFTLLYLGRFSLGDSFRLGTAKEETRLKTSGLFSLSRNPMYVGVYATIAAAILYTLNPLVFFLGAFVVVVHHAIVIAEEKHMVNVFGREYADYQRRVRRYV